MPNNLNPSHRRTHRWAFPLGLLIIVLAIVGAVRAVTWGIDKISKITDDSEKRAEYESFLVPVVMNDPDAFDDISKANMSQLLDITVWSLLNSDISPNDYDLYEGETAGLLVPQEDIEAQFKELFGSDIAPDHTKASGSAYGFTYNSSLKSYIIPLTGVVPTYTPKVYKIDEKGSSVILTVGYLSGSEWTQDKQGNYIAPEPGKYMKITLRKSGDNYYLSAIQATDAADIVDDNQTQALVTKAPLQTTAPALTTTGKAVSTTKAAG
jgi:hypothetical protein